MMWKTLLFSLLCICIISPIYSQSDEINISAAFAQSIALRVTSGANITWTFSTISDYENGKVANSYFEVSSSTNFNVDVSFTPFTNAEGDELNLKNLSFRVRVPIASSGGQGTRWDFGAHNTSNNGAQESTEHFSGVHFATTTPRTILVPGPNGNAGDYAENIYRLTLRLGSKTHSSDPAINLPVLLDQNIAPGVYTCTVTLEAIPVVI
ncbi:MAG: hypothetical protein AAF655_05675 [Bacteroidota bacterium]